MGQQDKDLPKYVQSEFEAYGTVNLSTLFQIVR
jgi:hypothetical protein